MACLCSVKVSLLVCKGSCWVKMEKGHSFSTYCIDCVGDGVLFTRGQGDRGKMSRYIKEEIGEGSYIKAG